MNRLVNKLLGRHVNGWQLAGFVLANLLGMTIVLLAVQGYHDALPLFSSNDSFFRPGQLVITKRVSSLGTLTGGSTTFSEQEVADLESQPFVRRLGRYTPAQFEVFATVGGGNLPMRFSTDMFFESVPDAFLDVSTEEWAYDPESDEVPIVLPRTYLNLYNFGFASSQGLPAVSEGIISAVTINLRLRGARTTLLKTGRVVAFSRTLNTILVPQAFMDDMNARLSPGQVPQAARLILQTDNPADSRIADYIRQHHYDTETNEADASRATAFLRLVTMAVLVVGLIISALAFYVLLLSIFLLLQKQTEKIDNLLLIGYSPRMVARPFQVLTILLNLLILVLAIALVALVRSWYLPHLGNLYDQFSPAQFLPVLLVGAALFLVVTILNEVAIRRKIMRIWHLHES